ncbi:tripartite tricarboxylate transporter substrate binding protein [Pigmentiphaga soli]|uniref:Tripartite tricarboxylate transporter substrate binding protein n=1 Tax=Pigmentiphaga soli TaxID=1007095 RepID=A0ABP8HMU0_9BURK
MFPISRLCAAALAAALPVLAPAQDAFPAKPIHMVVCCTGTPEAVARMLASDMSDRTGQPVVVEARPGANGILAASYAAKAEADGYTVFIGTNSTHAANQSLYRKLPYDYVSDFAPLTGILQGNLMAAVNARSKVRSIGELTEMARREPGRINFGYGSSSVRAAAELYSQLAGIRLTGVPYKTNPQAATDLVGGRVDLMIADTVTLMPLVESGKLRALAVTGTKRLQAQPQLPTMAEAGVPGYALTYWLGAWAPAGTPAPVVARLNQLLTAALKSERVREFIAKAGGEPYPTTPQELMRFQTAEKEKWARIVAGAGIEPE